MFEEFSSGYYLGRLFVQPDARCDAVLREGQFLTLGEALHGEGWSGSPLVMRIDRQHFTVGGEKGVPDDTLLLPDRYFADHQPDRRRGVLLAKPDVEDQLLPFVDHSDNEASSATADPFLPDAFSRIN